MTSRKKAGVVNEDTKSDKRRTRGTTVPRGRNRKKDKESVNVPKDDTVRGAGEIKGWKKVRGQRIPDRRPLTGLIDASKRQELIDHIETILNQYGFVVVNAAVSVGTTRSCMLTSQKVKHNSSVADVVLLLDNLVTKYAEDNAENKDVNMFDVISALVYYVLIVHVNMTQANADYKKIAEAAQEIIARTMNLEMKNGVDDESEYEVEEGFYDPSVR
jgi:hypothetical protein